MVCREVIPCHFSIGEFQVKISYAGQQQVCVLSAAPGHIFRVCPLRGKCFLCGIEGHLSRNCPQRAAYRAGDDVREPDPTLSALVAPQAESDLRDNSEVSSDGHCADIASCKSKPPVCK